MTKWNRKAPKWVVEALLEAAESGASPRYVQVGVSPVDEGPELEPPVEAHPWCAR